MNSATSPQIIPIVKESVPYTPFETLWVPHTASFIVLGENPRRTGTISIYQLDFGSNDNDEKEPQQKQKKQRETLKLQTKETKPNGFKCGTFGQSFNKKSESSRQFATGDFKGTLNIWDIAKINKPVFEVENAHSEIINAIDGISGNGAAEIATGSRDGTVKIWDPRTTKPVAEMRASKGNDGRDCWSVCFGDSYNAQHRMVAAGYDNGDVKILDLRTNKMFFEDNVKNGVCSVEFDRRNIKINKLIVSTLESRYRVYDLKTKHISEGFPFLSVDTLNKGNMSTNTFSNIDNKKGSRGTTIWRVRHLPQNRDIWVTTSGNGCASIWKYTYPDERVIVDDKGHKKGVMGEVTLLSDQVVSSLSTQPIVSWDWNSSKTGLAAMASLDQTIQVVVVTKLNKL